MILSRKNILILFSVLIFAAIIQSCSIKEPTAPNWDVSLNVPIANKNYTMLNILEDKSDLILHYTSGTNANLLYYADTKKMDEIILGQKIKPDASTNPTPGTISISSDSIVSNIGYSWLSPTASAGMQTIVPVVPETDMNGIFNLATEFQTIKMASGLIDVTITNYFPSPVRITLRNIVLKNSGTGEIIAQTSAPIEILPLQSSVRKSIPITTGVAVKNQLILEAKISSTGSSGQQITLPTYSMSLKAKFYNLKVSEYTGQLKPTTFDKTRTAVGLDVKDIQKKLKFQQINLKNPKVELHLRLTTDVEFSINGTVEARNTLGQKSVMTLSARTLNKTLISQADSVLIINSDSLSNFFKNFSQFPDSLVAYIGGTVNPNRKTITINGNDKVTISGKFEIPFEFGLTEGIFADSVKVDLNDNDRDKIKDVNSLSSTLKITNGIPASISFTAKLYDRNNNFLTYFPPKYSDQDTVVSVNGAGVDSNGNAIVDAVQNVTVKTLKTEIDKIRNASYMKVRIKLNTSGVSGQQIRFKIDNAIKFLASGSTNYHVNP